MSERVPPVKRLTVAQLQAALAQVPRGHWLVPNQVGNLAVYKESNGQILYTGYIDFRNGEYEAQ